jgi:hypothetical protein
LASGSFFPRKFLKERELFGGFLFLERVENLTGAKGLFRRTKMSQTTAFDENNPDHVLGVYRQMQSECQQIMGKIQELNLEKEEHKLVLDTLNKLDGGRTAYRLVGGVLVEKTCGTLHINVVHSLLSSRDAGILVEVDIRTNPFFCFPHFLHFITGDILPVIKDNFSGINELTTKLEESQKTKEAERRAFKEKHGIMTQEERDAAMKKQVRQAEATAGKASE